MRIKTSKFASVFGILIILLGNVGVQLAAAQADVSHSILKYPVEYSVYHYCYGETVPWRGYIQWVSQTTIDAQGNAHIQYHGHSKLSGIGSVSGRKYEAIWNDNTSRQLIGPGPWRFTTTHYYRAVVQKNGPVLMNKTTNLIEISPNGTWTLVSTEMTWYCEGEVNPVP